MDLHRTSNYRIGTMCGGESPYKSEQQQQLIEQGLIPNPLYHSQHPGPQHPPTDRNHRSQSPQQQQTLAQGQVCGPPMARPMATIGPGWGIVPYSTLTNGSNSGGGLTGGGGANYPMGRGSRTTNGHSNGTYGNTLGGESIDDNSAMNAARRLIGDTGVVPVQQGIAGRGPRGGVQARMVDTGQYPHKDEPLELTTNNAPPVIGQSANGSATRRPSPLDGTTGATTATAEEILERSQHPQMGAGPCESAVVRQPNGRRLSTDGVPVGGVVQVRGNGNMSNGLLLPSAGSPGIRPSVKRCASVDWDEDANKKDMKRTSAKDSNTYESLVAIGHSPPRATLRDQDDCTAVPPQPKKRGRRKKSEVLAAEMARKADLVMGGNRDERNVQMNAVIGAVIEDVRRAGREKKPYDPWANRKASGRPFVQDGPCFALLDVTSKKFPKCSSCRVNDEVSECRFSEFRKLRFVGDLVQVDGFTDSDDAQETDCRIWMTADLRSNDAGVPSPTPAGFPHPNDNKQQTPGPQEPPAQNAAINRLDEKTAVMVLTNVGDIMCDLVREEAKAKSDYIDWMPSETGVEGGEAKVKWRRVYGVREMCDVCSTTIFNLHWTCGQCGFVACIDCFRARAKRDEAIDDPRPQRVNAASPDPGNHNPLTLGHQLGGVGINGREYWTTRRSREQHQLYPDKDEFRWLYCGNPKIQRSHSPRKLLMTQIVPGDILERVNRQQHEVRRQRGIPMRCGCDCGAGRPSGQQRNGVSGSFEQTDSLNPLTPTLTKPALRLAARSRLKKLMAPASNGLSFKRLLATEIIRSIPRKLIENPSEVSIMALQTPFNVATASSTAASGLPTQVRSAAGTDLADLRVLADIATQRYSLGPAVKAELPSVSDSLSATERGFSRIHGIASAVLEARLSPDQRRPLARLPVSANRLESLAPRVGQKSEGRRMYAAPHEWLCNGKLLLLLEATHSHNLELFQEQWNRGQPVVVAHVSEVLNMDLWRPDAFLRDFGEQKSTLVDCKTGADLGKPIPMKRFWEGFECFAKRMCDKNGEHMLLKLKDWPPDENFSEVLPTRYTDLMRALPLPMYTLREGSLNLANRLPDCFVPPDLGPKMYNAYGSALFPTKGTTNLHLDMSDAANVMVYVGIPRDGNCQRHIEEALRAVEEAGCDATQMKRVREKGAKVGAVWHIFHAQDAEKIRELLKQVMVERGQRLEANSDPIHDQLWYLDCELRRRLLLEKGVRGYAIAQCVGDAVFIPAGAPHQVRNLHSCIKVAEDFVSPENLAHCLRLTNEFRFLSDTHTNHEDKLQIKNVVYHAVKDAVSVLDEGDRPCADSC